MALGWLDRWAVERLRSRGYVPAPAGFGSWGAEASGSDSAPVDYLTYARISNVVYACATLRARALAGLPMRFFAFKGAAGRGGKRIRLDRPNARLALPVVGRGGKRLADAGDAVEIEAGPVVDLLSRVNDETTQRTWIYQTEMSLSLAGQAKSVLDRGQGGKLPPRAMWLTRHDRLTETRGGRGEPSVTGWTLDKNKPGEMPLTAGEVLWMRYPDPNDPDYGALPPMAAARLGADSYTAAMRANKAIFDNGIMAPGMLMPPKGEGDEFFTPTQLDAVAGALEKRATGVDKAHRLLAVPYRFEVQGLNLTPKDAEFQGLLDFAIEDVARAYGVPVEFVGGSRRTYQNLENADRSFYSNTIGPEAAWLAEELTERLLPMFGDGAGVDFIAFDLSAVSALQEDETAAWNRSSSQIASGAITVNEWRTTQGLEPLEVDAKPDPARAPVVLAALQAMGVGTVTPEAVTAFLVEVAGLLPDAAEAIVGDGPPELPPAPAEAPRGAPEAVPAAPSPSAGASDDAATRDAFPALGSAEHVALWNRAVKPAEDEVDPVRVVVVGLFERHRDAIVDRLGNAGRSRAITLSDLATAFQRARWIREYREAMRRALRSVVTAGGRAVAKQFDAPLISPDDPAAIRYLHGRSQRFAQLVNETTWEQLQASLGEGIDAGEGVPDLAARVKDVMGARIRSSAETIARTEVIPSYVAGGRLTAAAIERDTGLRLTKTWVAALDERTRSEHAALHGTTLPLADDFEAGGSQAAGPGEFGDPEMDINCRCALTYGEEGRSVTTNDARQLAAPGE